MKISFHGGARTVTGSKHLIHTENGLNILLDCGMFQGMGKETDALNRHFGFDPATINFVILSHAHIDHTGLLPKLVKEGFTGKIYCTPATRDLTEILLRDSAEIQTYEIEHKKGTEENACIPLYDVNDVENTLGLFEVKEYDQYFSPHKDVSVLFTNAGHLVGASVVNLTIREKRTKVNIAYSGDIGRYRSVLLKAPSEFPQADYVILESTYGDKHHDISFNNVDTISQWVKRICHHRQGKLVIPAFSVGRTQEILYALNQLSLEKRLPSIPVFVDSPLSSKATEVIKKYTDCFNERLQNVLLIDDDPFDFEGLKYVESVEDSKKLMEFSDACIIISSSGTADAGRVRHHIFNTIEEEKHCVLMAGYCSDHSLGGTLLRGAKMLEVNGEEKRVASEIGKLQGMSAHGDSDDLIQFISCQDPEKLKGIFLVHGEYEVQKAFSQRLNARGYYHIEVPKRHQQIETGARKRRRKLIEEPRTIE